MKQSLLGFLILTCLSCAPLIQYIGDEHPPTNKIDTYYSKEDIKVNYKVIGQMLVYPRQSSMEEVKASMIKEAKSKGANAILFEIKELECSEGTTGVKAELILY